MGLVGFIYVFLCHVPKVHRGKKWLRAVLAVAFLLWSRAVVSQVCGRILGSDRANYGCRSFEALLCGPGTLIHFGSWGVIDDSRGSKPRDSNSFLQFMGVLFRRGDDVSLLVSFSWMEVVPGS